MVDSKRIIGYYMGDAFYIDDNGHVCVESNLCQRINRRVSEINKDLKRTTKLYQEYIEKQVRLKGLLSKKAVQLSDYELRRVKKIMEQNRRILRGMANFITQLKSEKTMIQKNHPKNMKKQKKEE